MYSRGDYGEPKTEITMSPGYEGPLDGYLVIIAVLAVVTAFGLLGLTYKSPRSYGMRRAGWVGLSVVVMVLGISGAVELLRSMPTPLTEEAASWFLIFFGAGIMMGAMLAPDVQVLDPDRRRPGQEFTDKYLRMRRWGYLHLAIVCCALLGGVLVLL